MSAIVPTLAAMHYNRGEDVSVVLAAAIARLRRRGVAIGGLLQEPEMTGSTRCQMLELVDLRTGERASITQDRGSESRGCKLDEQGLLSMAHCVEAAISDGVDLIVISRFGRAEAAGHGLLASCADVVCAGIPLLTAVREPYVERWRDFHGGLAAELSCSADAVLDWFGSISRGGSVHSTEASPAFLG
jgi:nucleoside-triphosphatase THEP1